MVSKILNKIFLENKEKQKKSEAKSNINDSSKHKNKNSNDKKNEQKKKSNIKEEVKKRLKNNKKQNDVQNTKNNDNKDSAEESDEEENAKDLKPYIKKNKKEKNKKSNSDNEEDDNENEKGINIKDNTEKKVLNRLTDEDESSTNIHHKFLKARKEFEQNLSTKKNFNKFSADSNTNEEEGYSIMRKYDNKQASKENPNEDSNNNSNNNFNTNNHNNKKACNEKDIFCQCKDHPRYRPCVCLAFPNAEICVKDFCKEEKNKLSYECNPKLNCLTDENDTKEICKCKTNFDSLCACKLNPLSKDCFCRKYPISHLCNNQNCSFEKESIFCKCADAREKKNNSICQDYYCRLNPNAPQCFCLISPEDNYCKCLNDPAKCESIELLLIMPIF